MKDAEQTTQTMTDPSSGEAPHQGDPGEPAEPTLTDSPQGRASGGGEPTERLPRTTLVWDPPTRTWQRVGERAAPASTVSRERSPALRAGLIGGLVGAIVASVLTAGVLRLLPDRSAGTAVERVLSPAGAASSGNAPIVDLAERARPSVVNIDVAGRRSGFFGGQFQGTGSGVIVRSDGYIVTNAHVVAGASEVTATLNTGERESARVIGADRDTDLAVVKVERDDLTPAVLGSSKDLQVGELAIAIGSPLGLEQSVTAGIVSALGRTVDRQGQAPLVDMIQTDAAVTQGNSGGALFNGRGALIGINTAIAASPEVGAEGIAFAIPIDIAKAVFDELISTGRATHPWIGIVGSNLDPTTARRFGVEKGALIGDLVPGGPADKAGLQARDVIVRMDGTGIDDMGDLVVAIRQRQVGETVKIEYVRQGERKTADVTLGDRPSSS